MRYARDALPQKKHDPRLLELARRGAQAQLNDLVHEIEMLLELFPHLRDTFNTDELPISFLLKKGARRAATKRRPLSASARKKISDAQKKRWALARAAGKTK